MDTKGRQSTKGNGKGKGRDAEKQCYTCGHWGHISRNCTSVNEMGEYDEFSCHPCGEEEDEIGLFELDHYIGEWEEVPPKRATAVARKDFPSIQEGIAAPPGRGKNMAKQRVNKWKAFQLEESDDEETEVGEWSERCASEGSDDEISEFEPRDKTCDCDHIMTLTSSDWADKELLAEVSESQAQEFKALGWEKITAVVDSGAVDSALPEECLPDMPLEETPESRAKKAYRGAGGQEIAIKGKKKVQAVTSDGPEEDDELDGVRSAPTADQRQQDGGGRQQGAARGREPPSHQLQDGASDHAPEGKRRLHDGLVDQGQPGHGVGKVG